eukprot:scaffold1581_cov342-Prasinococcus_capsulatus_cf.AAC.10
MRPTKNVTTSSICRSTSRTSATWATPSSTCWTPTMCSPSTPTSMARGGKSSTARRWVMTCTGGCQGPTMADPAATPQVATVSYGRIQGRDALKDHFQNSSLMHEEKRCRPIIFHYPSSRASGSGSTSRSVQLTSNNPEQREAGEAEAFPSTPKSSKYHSQRGN